MTLRFYRRVRIAPGVTLNLSKRNASVSVGVRGAHVTTGTSGSRATIGVPKTGIYYTEKLGAAGAANPMWLLVGALIGVGLVMLVGWLIS
jgi:hypothetical protein